MRGLLTLTSLTVASVFAARTASAEVAAGPGAANRPAGPETRAVVAPPEARRPPSVSWDNLNGGAGGQIQDVVLDPSTDDRAFVMSDVEGMYRTDDGGTSWAFAGRGLAGTDTLALAVDPTDPNRVYLGTTVGLHASSDGGLTWRLHADVARDGNAGRLTRTGGSEQLAIGSVVVDPDDGDRVVAGMGNKRESSAGQATVFVSSDRGATFQPVAFGPDTGGNFSILQLAYDGVGDVLYAAVQDGGVWRSTDFGRTAGGWSRVARPSGTAERAEGVAVSPDGSKLYAAYRTSPASADTAVYGSPASTIAWDQLDGTGFPGTSGRTYRQLVVDPRAASAGSDRLLVAGEREREGLYEIAVTWDGATASDAWTRIFHYADARSAPFDTGWEGGIYGNQPRPLAYAYAPTGWAKNEIWTTGDQTLFKVDRALPSFADKWDAVYTSDPVQTFTGVTVNTGEGLAPGQTIKTYSSTGWQSTVDFDADQFGDIVISGKADSGVVMSWDGGRSWEDYSSPRISRSNAVGVFETSPGQVYVVAHLAAGYGADVTGGELWAYKVPDPENPKPGPWVFLGGGGGAAGSDRDPRGLPNTWYDGIVQDRTHTERIYIATRDQGTFVIPDLAYLYNARTADQPLPYYNRIAGSPNSPDDRNNPIFVDPNDSNRLYVVNDKELWQGVWNPPDPADTSSENFENHWTWTKLRTSLDPISADVWKDGDRTRLAATFRDAAGDRVIVSGDGGATWADSFDLDDLRAVRTPTFDFSEVTPEVFSVAGDGGRVYAVVQKNGPENLGYGVFQVDVDAAGRPTAYADVTGDLPFAKSFNFEVVRDAKTAKKYLMLSSWGAGTWRFDLANAPDGTPVGTPVDGPGAGGPGGAGIEAGRPVKVAFRPSLEPGPRRSLSLPPIGLPTVGLQVVRASAAGLFSATPLAPLRPWQASWDGEDDGLRVGPRRP